MPINTENAEPLDPDDPDCQCMVIDNGDRSATVLACRPDCPVVATFAQQAEADGVAIARAKGIGPLADDGPTPGNIVSFIRDDNGTLYAEAHGLVAAMAGAHANGVPVASILERLAAAVADADQHIAFDEADPALMDAARKAAIRLTEFPFDVHHGEDQHRWFEHAQEADGFAPLIERPDAVLVFLHSILNTAVQFARVASENGHEADHGTSLTVAFQTMAQWALWRSRAVDAIGK